jgi:hypothetical protein
MMSTTTPDVAGDRHTNPMTVADLLKSLGVLITFCMQLKDGRKRDAWSENAFRKIDLVKRSISYKRFQYVMRNLSFVGERVDDGTLTFKVAPLMETFRRRCIDNWSMGPMTTYDEMAVGMTGRGKKGLTQTF